MIKINETIGFDYNMNPKDVQKIKTVLNELGYYKAPDYGITPYPDTKMFDAIKTFQMAENLTADGIIKPEGPTLKALNRKINSDTPGVRGPDMRCPNCGGFHGGSKGDLCPDCASK